MSQSTMLFYIIFIIIVACGNSKYSTYEYKLMNDRDSETPYIFIPIQKKTLNIPNHRNVEKEIPVLHDNVTLDQSKCDF